MYEHSYYIVMVIVKIKQTMQTVVLMVVTIVEEMSTPIIVQNGFAMKKIILVC